MRKRPSPWLPLLLLTLMRVPTTTATGNSYETLPAIKLAAETFFRANRSQTTAERAISVGRLDPNLRLVACDEPLQTSQPPGARALGATSVNVRCEGSQHWSIFIPVQVRERRRVMVATRTLTPGTVIAVSDVVMGDIWITDAAGDYVEEPASLVGKKVLRVIGAGSPLPMSGLHYPRTIQRGAPVTLAIEIGTLAVKMSGVAMQDGAIGDRIQARNNTSQRVVEGVISAEGTIVLN